MRTITTCLVCLLFAVVPMSAQDCDLVVDKTFPNGGYVKTTRQTTMYSLEPNRSLRLFMENLDGETTLGVNWYISPKALPSGSSFNGKKPLELTITLADGKKVTITVLEPMPGSGTYKLKYADYMIGGLANLDADKIATLKASPISTITESIYGVTLTQTEVADTSKAFFVEKLECIGH